MARSINAASLAAAGNLSAIADLIELIKDPEYAKRIPELVEANETLAKAEDFRTEVTQFYQTKEDLTAREAALGALAEELATTLSDLELREKALEANSTEVAIAFQNLDIKQSEFEAEVAKLEKAKASVAKKQATLDAITESKQAELDAIQVLKTAIQNKLTVLGDI